MFLKIVLKMVVDSSNAYTGSTVVKGKRHQVTTILKRRVLNNTRQRGGGCFYEFLVQLDGCKMSSLAEWVDEKDLDDCTEIIKEFLGTIMRVLLLLVYYSKSTTTSLLLLLLVYY